MGNCLGSTNKEQPDVADALDVPVTLGNPFPDFDGRNLKANFKLGKDLGEGAYAKVVEGTYSVTGRTYAVKMVRKANLAPEDEADLLEEVKILRQLNHPNIIDIYQFYRQERDNYYVIIEYMRGGELFDRIVKKQFYTEKEARDLCKILLDAIKYCHDRDIVHRDLKPENLLLTSNDDDASIKLADFGFAKALNGSMVTTQCGTPAYVAPEILRHRPYGTSVDMWSIGVIIYILLGGYPPFHDENQTRLFRKIRAGKFEFHNEYWGSISSDAKDLISRLLTVDQHSRLTAREAVSHPWLLTSDTDLAARNLGKNLEQLKLFNARRKLRAAIKSVLVARRMAHFANARW
ncbi:kinase-like domain-containing protein [Tribonema minus]|uniref:non-specific serine/threonine protein kinase n=1 Tax=Tribonema minus TaxID=303371 RepID=A0A835YZ60_9STRA|nr:kinase-like domain-containing protein [Tribonema minus]